ncbi:hypothetical protein VTO73DRAFT_15446 [Trametes versicolor]
MLLISTPRRSCHGVNTPHLFACYHACVLIFHKYPSLDASPMLPVEEASQHEEPSQRRLTRLQQHGWRRPRRRPGCGWSGKKTQGHGPVHSRWRRVETPLRQNSRSDAAIWSVAAARAASLGDADVLLASGDAQPTTNAADGCHIGGPRGRTTAWARWDDASTAAREETTATETVNVDQRLGRDEGIEYDAEMISLDPPRTPGPARRAVGKHNAISASHGSRKRHTGTGLGCRLPGHYMTLCARFWRPSGVCSVFGAGFGYHCQFRAHALSISWRRSDAAALCFSHAHTLAL